jgi:hypothetical protein
MEWRMEVDEVDFSLRRATFFKPLQSGWGNLKKN